MDTNNLIICIVLAAGIFGSPMVLWFALEGLLALWCKRDRSKETSFAKMEVWGPEITQVSRVWAAVLRALVVLTPLAYVISVALLGMWEMPRLNENTSANVMSFMLIPGMLFPAVLVWIHNEPHRYGKILP